MDLENLKGFDVASLMSEATGRPLRLPVGKIEPDPDNIRSRIDPQALQELAESIRNEGLIQPISVRPHPSRQGHYLINAGERRWRAVQLLGLDSIEAYVREEFDPYVQAIENLQREALSALDLARWVAKREAEGESRATIARRLGKPASFITEAAILAQAPDEIVGAFDSGRIPDTRTAYLLTRAWNERSPAMVRELLTADAPLTRAGAVSALAQRGPSGKRAPTEGNTGGAGRAKGGAVLEVEVAGRKGYLTLRAGRTSTSGQVRFSDGGRETVALETIRLIRWVGR